MINMNEIKSDQFNELLYYIETFNPSLKYLSLIIIGYKTNENSYDAIGVKAEFLHEANPKSEIILDIPELIVYHNIRLVDIEEIKKFVEGIKNRGILINNFSFYLRHFNNFGGVRLKGHEDYISYFYYRTIWPYYLFESASKDERIKDFLDEDDLNKNLNRQGYENLIEVSKKFLDCNIGYDWPFRFYLIIPIKILVDFEIENEKIIFALKCHSSVKIDEIEIVTNIETVPRQRLKIKLNSNDKISEEGNLFSYRKIEHISTKDINFIKIWVYYQNEEIDQISKNLKLDSRTYEINENLLDLKRTIESLKNQLNISSDENEIYDLTWKLKDSYDLAKDKYHSLEVWSKEPQTKNYYKYLFNEIFYYESCLKMLKNKYGKMKIDYRHYLIVAQLECVYLLKCPFPKKFNEFRGSGIFKDEGIDMIINNIQNAQANINLFIEDCKKKVDHKSLFIYYELLGDLEIHKFCYFKKYELISHRKSLLRAISLYEISIKHKIQLENSEPGTFFDGLHGWESHYIFHEFYSELGVQRYTDVREKLAKLRNNYPLTPEELEQLDQLITRKTYEEG